MAFIQHDVVERPVVNDVWSYVTKDFGPPEGDETTQVLCHVRRDKHGILNCRRLDDLNIVGRSIVHAPGSLMNGLDRNPLRRVATAAELVARMEKGESFIIDMPAFKMIHGTAMRDGERVGTVLRNGDVELEDGTMVPFASTAAVTPPSPLC
jgi:hypothetical protein